MTQKFNMNSKNNRSSA